MKSNHRPFSGQVIIIGGGIAGNALALFLDQAGIASTIYEARLSQQGMGGGFGIAPNGMAVLDQLGLAEAATARGCAIHENCFYNASGRVLACFKNGTANHKYPAVSLMRSALHEVMQAAVAARHIPVCAGKKLVDVTYSHDQVIAHFEDGSQAAGDLLVAADGIHSQVRRVVFPEAPAPAYSGIIGISGVAPAAAVPLAEKQRFNFTYGVRGFIGYSGVEHGEVMWWANLPSPRELNREELTHIDLEQLKRDMLTIYGDYHTPIPDLIRHTHSPIKHNISDIPSLRTWHRGRVVLIGDAAHAVSPNSGQGGSIALEDALYLAKLLRQSGDYQQVFTTFEQARKPRVEKIAAAGRRIGNDKKLVSPFKQKMREVMMSFFLKRFGSTSQDSVYNYRIAWE